MKDSSVSKETPIQLGVMSEKVTIPGQNNFLSNNRIE